MAFLSQDDEDKEQPQLSGGLTPSPMTQGAQGAPSGGSRAPSPMGAQKSAMQGTGSNFVNLRSFLADNVAQQQQQNVRDLGKGLYLEENKALDKAAAPVRNATFTPIQGSAREMVEKLVPQPRDPTPNGASSQGTGYISQADIDAQEEAKKNGTAPPPSSDHQTLATLQSMLTQDYTGPSTVDYDTTTSKGFQRLNNLGNADTAAQAMNPGAFTKDGLASPTYGQGNSWLSNAMIKGDAGTMQQVGAAKTAAEKHTAATGRAKDSAAKKVDALKTQARGARERAKGELEAYGNVLTAGIQARADQKNAQSASDYANGIVRDAAGNVVTLSDGSGPLGKDPVTGQPKPAPSKQTVGEWQPGSGTPGHEATAANTADTTERGRLSLLASLLGMDDYNLPEETYKPGGYAIQEDDPSKNANELQKTLNATPKTSYYGNITQAQYDGMTPTQKQRFEERKRQGRNSADAYAYAMANG